MFLYVFVIFIGLVSGQLERIGPESVIYQCPPSQVLSVYEQELDFAIFTYIVCTTPNICEEPLTCTPSAGQCPPAAVSGLSFLQRISQSARLAPLIKGCCTYSPTPEDYESTDCSVITVRDTATGTGQGDSEQNFRRRGRQRFLARKKRQSGIKPGGSVRLVNDISPIPNGFSINACTIRCKRTTTTRRPSTRTPDKPTKKPDDPTNPDPSNNVDPSNPVQPPVAVPIGGGAACFSGEGLVETPQGPKRLDELKTHEQVLVTWAPNGSPVYQPVDMWYHRLADFSTEFMRLTTSSGNELLLTPNHLLPIFDCVSHDLSKAAVKHSRLAAKAKVGKCLAVLGENGLGPEPIVKVEREVKRGIYSPITAQGTILVNGVQASCFTTVEDQISQQTLHRLVLKLYSALGYLTGADWEAGDVPAPLRLAKQLANVIFPESLF